MNALAIHHKYVSIREVKTVISLPPTHTHLAESMSADCSSGLSYLCKCRLVKHLNTGAGRSVDVPSGLLLCTVFHKFISEEVVN